MTATGPRHPPVLPSGALTRPGSADGAPVRVEGYPGRTDGYAPLQDYAVIGDGRAAALIAKDGSVDWLAWPDMDSAAVFAAVLDAEQGGRFLLEPEVPAAVTRRYLPGTNVLETTFTTSDGVVRVTDALTFPNASLGPARELLRRVEGLSGSVPLRWTVEPRFEYGTAPTRIARRAQVPVATSGTDALAVCAWDAGEPQCSRSGIHSRILLDQGARALISLAFAYQEPLVLPTRDECEARLEHTSAAWQRWSEERPYDGPWRDAVLRSALALKLLVFAPSGAVAAAATCSLPEDIGGERNWDYRYCWVRDSAFTIDSFLRLGCAPEAAGYFWWLMHASQLTHPRLHVLYRLDGGAHAPESTLPLEGHRRSAPVRKGNAAAEQLQLDTYGELMQTAWLYTMSGHRLDADLARRLAQTADFLCAAWRQPDSGIWEVRSAPAHFTQSKMMCWVALDRAIDLAGRGLIPSGHTARWHLACQEIRGFIETNCFSSEKRSYVRQAEQYTELDAGVLLGLLYGYWRPGDERFQTTLDAIQRELRHGPYVRRYSGEDGLTGCEGAFVPCSFWLAEALARSGQVAKATALMDELVAIANDVGLYSEEVDPDTGASLGNLPQALSHLALIRAACTIGEAT